jgi:hypothetical protein
MRAESFVMELSIPKVGAIHSVVGCFLAAGAETTVPQP